MSSSIPYPNALGLYIPVHRRAPSLPRTPSPSPSSSSSTLSRSPSSSPAPSHYTLPAYTPGIYTPADLLLLSSSPLSKRSADEVNARLQAVAPELLQSRKQRKAAAWHSGRHAGIPSSHGSESSDGERSSWRRA